VGLPATKGTSKIPATGVSGMGEEKYPAMLAPGQIGPEIRINSQNRAKGIVVLQD